MVSSRGLVGTIIDVTAKGDLQRTIRNLDEDDASAVLTLVNAVLARAKTTVTAPEEFTFTEDQERAYLRNFQHSQNSLALGSFMGGRLVGVLFLEQLPKIRALHRAVVGFSVHPSMWAQGIGTELVRCLLARLHSLQYIRQIEASVLSNNVASERILRSAGFRRVGRIPTAILMDDGYLDEILFVLDLGATHPDESR